MAEEVTSPASHRAPPDRARWLLVCPVITAIVQKGLGGNIIDFILIAVLAAVPPALLWLWLRKLEQEASAQKQRLLLRRVTIELAALGVFTFALVPSAGWLLPSVAAFLLLAYRVLDAWQKFGPSAEDSDSNASLAHLLPELRPFVASWPRLTTVALTFLKSVAIAAALQVVGWLSDKANENPGPPFGLWLLSLWFLVCSIYYCVVVKRAFVAAGPKDENELSPLEALVKSAGVYDVASAESEEGRTDAAPKEESDASESDCRLWRAIARANGGTYVEPSPGRPLAYTGTLLTPLYSRSFALSESPPWRPQVGFSLAVARGQGFAVYAPQDPPPPLGAEDRGLRVLLVHPNANLMIGVADSLKRNMGVECDEFVHLGSDTGILFFHQRHLGLALVGLSQAGVRVVTDREMGSDSVVAVTVRFKRLAEDSQAFGSTDEQVVSRVYFDLEVEGRCFRDLTVDVKQTPLADIEFARLEVSLPRGYDGNLNCAALRRLTERYYRDFVGSGAEDFHSGSGGLRFQRGYVRRRENVINAEQIAIFDYTPESAAW